MAKQVNKHGIPVDTGSVKRKKRQQEMQKLNFKKYAELVRYENDKEIKLVILNHPPVVQAMMDHGWKLKGYTRGEIA